KSEAGERDVPLSPMVVTTLTEWKLECPRRKDDGSLHYVFPNGKGNVEIHENVVRRRWHPLQLAAGITVQAADKEGNPVTAAKYTGLHCLRHFYASWCAARVQDGGLGLPLKTVQTRLGHSTLAMTSDTYGHLFPSTDDAEVLAAGE